MHKRIYETTNSLEKISTGLTIGIAIAMLLFLSVGIWQVGLNIDRFSVNSVISALAFASTPILAMLLANGMQMNGGRLAQELEH